MTLSKYILKLTAEGQGGSASTEVSLIKLSLIS